MELPVFIKGCKVILQNASSKVVLDPCSCSTYYKLKTDVISPERELVTCDVGLLWNHNTSQCQQKATVVQDDICNPREPWGRCMDTSETFKAEMKQTCIAEGSFKEPSPGTLSATLSPDAQLANVELAMASMVAGSVITLMLVAIIWTFCNKQTLRMPQKLWKLLKHRQKKAKPTPVVTEGDNISVIYEDIDEEDTMDTGYMAPEVRGGNLPVQPAIIKPTVVPSNEPVINKPAINPPRKPPAVHKNAASTSVDVRQSQEPGGQGAGLRKVPIPPPKIKPVGGSGLKMVPKPAGSSPKVPQKPPHAAKLPKDSKMPVPPLVPPKKRNQPLTEDESYLHAVSP